MDPCIVYVVLAVLYFILKESSWFESVFKRDESDEQGLFREYRVTLPSTGSNAIIKTVGYSFLADLRKSFERIAEQTGGRVSGNPLPRIVTTVRGYRCVVSLQEVAPMAPSDPFESVPARARFYTRFSVFVPKSFRKRLELYPQRTGMDIKYLKMFDIQIGVPEFDARYVIKSNDEEFARKFLTQDVRAAIDILRKTNRKDEVFVSMNKERLNIAIAGVYRNHETNKLFFDMCVNVFDRLVDYCESNAGLRVMEVATGTGACPVCGESLNENTVACKNCGTPHHKACWDFNEKCAIFGCGCIVYSDKE